MKQFQLKNIWDFIVILHSSTFCCFTSGAVVKRFYQTSSDSRPLYPDALEYQSDRYGSLNALETGTKMSRDYNHVNDIQTVSKQRVLLDKITERNPTSVALSRMRRDANPSRTSRNQYTWPVRRIPLSLYQQNHAGQSQRGTRPRTNWRPIGRNNFMRVVTLSVSYERPGQRHRIPSRRRPSQDRSRPPLRRRPLEIL